ncbi:MAG: serine/threonine protein kinase [Deltaproteobacteria bacterium]|nr:serine/threonine protein kinase [Deltaproteobacteria bacterium]
MIAFELQRYTVDRRLAVGGMAEVFLARETLAVGIERPVVLKKLLRDKRDDEEFVTMFYDEARLLASLAHPNIGHIYAAGEAERDHWLVLEYVRGASLRELMSSAQTSGALLPETDVLGIGLVLAETLAYVHGACDADGRALHVVHRDLTPANVVVSRDGAVKLIDFGIARGENRVYETATGVLKGTCGYMAPEQLLEGHDLDQRVDVFAFGVILYEALTGRHPFGAVAAEELYDAILTARCVPLRKLRPHLGARLDRLLASCLSRKPDGRPGDMNEIATVLRAELAARGGAPLMADLAGLVRRLAPGDVVVREADVKSDVRTGRWVTEIER